MFSPQSVALKFFSYQEITDFRYFRNMISLLISQLYFDVILFDQKILIVLDSCLRSSFSILCVLFDTSQSLNRLPYQILKKIQHVHLWFSSPDHVRVTALEGTL